MADIITILHPENDANTNLYPNIVKENIPNGTIDNTKLSDDLKSLIYDGITIKSPLVDTTAHILEKTADEGIIVSSNSGNWYYWNGTQYVDSGLQYTQNVISNKMLANLVLRCVLEIDAVNKTMTIRGNFAFTKFSYVMLSTIPIKTISYDSIGNGTFSLIIRNTELMFVNVNTDLQINDKVLWVGYMINSNIDTEVYNCNNHKAHYALYSQNDLVIDTNNKNFITPNGYIFYDSGFISMTSQTISYNSYLGSTCILILRNKKYITGYLSNIVIDDNDIVIAIIGFNSNGTISNKIYMINDIKNLDYRVAQLETIVSDTLPKSSKIFMRVGCIGDSYTEGYMQDWAHKHNPNYAWPKYMEQLTGNKYTNFGDSGSSTKSWMNGTLGKLSEVQAEGNKCQAYIIGLMINDQDRGAANYVQLGTSADIGTDADSYYAYYYKLINACLAVNPDAKIFCNTCPKTSGNYASYNQAVVDIVTYCKNENKGVYLVDLRNYNWNNQTFINSAMGGHYAAIGYEYMAEILNKALCDVINDNVTDFQNVNLIDYDE